VSIEEVEKMKKIAKVFVNITCLVLLTVFVTGCGDKVDKKAIRQEQERMAGFTAQKFDNIKKIEFKKFEQHSGARTWFASAGINDNIYVRYEIDKVDGKSEIGMIYNSNELKEKKEEAKKVELNDIEIKYYEG